MRIIIPYPSMMIHTHFHIKIVMPLPKNHNIPNQLLMDYPKCICYTQSQISSYIVLLSLYKIYILFIVIKLDLTILK